MAHPRRMSGAVLREYSESAAVGIALIVFMPLLGLAALMLQGVLAALLAITVAIAATIGLWRLVAPALNPRVREFVSDYAGPTAFGVVAVVCMPLLGIVVLAARGAVIALVAIALVIAALAGLWRWALSPRHARPPYVGSETPQ